MLQSLSYLQQGNVKKRMKIVIDKEYVHIFQTTWENSIKFLMIVPKVTKKQGFTLSLENTDLEKPHGERQIELSQLFSG